MFAGKRNNINKTTSLTVDQALDNAFLCFKNGDFAKSEQICRLILDQPPHPDALNLLAQILSDKGKYTQAIEFLEKAISLTSDQAMLYNNLGLALFRNGQVRKALKQFKKAIDSNPEFAKAYNNLAAAYLNIDQPDHAAEVSQKAINLNPNFKQAHNNMGLAIKKQGFLTKSIAAFQKALCLDNDYIEALSNLGMTLIDMGNLYHAQQNLQRAADLAPESAQCQNNLGVLFNRQGKFEEAVRASEKAISLNPGYLQAYNNLGTALMELERFDEAERAFEKAAGIDKNCPPPHHNLGLILLLTGDFKRGWKEYEWRWKHEGFATPKRPFTQKWWDGSKKVKKVLIWGEQGIGDEVQFASLIPMVQEMGIEAVVECDKRLAGLFRRSFNGIEIFERSDRPSEKLFDASISHQIPMCSLPRALKLDLNDMQAGEAFLIPDQTRKEQLRKKYMTGEKCLLVGISWKSGNRQEGPKRTIGLENWRPVLQMPGVRFVNLQYGDCVKQLEKVKELFGIEILDDKTVNPFKDIEGFAAQTAAMDLVISVDNSTVHFAGALGTEVWTMLPTVPDWRWGLKGQRTNWYKQMKLFRQSKRGDWGEAIEKIAKDLQKKIND